MSMNNSNHRGTAALAMTGPGPIYTCPMHAEIKQPEPGRCPICGMTLVIVASAQVLAQ